MARAELFEGRTILAVSLGAVSLGAALACVSRKDFWRARAPTMAYVLVMLGATLAWSSLRAVRPAHGCGNCTEAHASESLLERFRCTWSWLNVFPGMVILAPFGIALLTGRLSHQEIDTSRHPDGLR
jgi:hypothetical protein